MDLSGPSINVKLKEKKRKKRYNRTKMHKVGVATRPERLCHDFGGGK
jgi:hypothetical protein